MQNYSAEENYFSEEGIEESTESLMRKLEVASDREAYKERFHDKGSSSEDAAGPSGASSAIDSSDDATNRKGRISPLSITVFAIVIGAIAGILLIMYVI